MNQLYPIIRRKRRPLISTDETNTTNVADAPVTKEPPVKTDEPPKSNDEKSDSKPTAE
jgi:hypothetical protein